MGVWRTLKRRARLPEQYAVYFNCQTNLVDHFRTLFSNDFAFEGNRALVLKLEQRVPEDALAFCIEASLVYHSAKKTPAGKADGRARRC